MNAWSLDLDISRHQRATRDHRVVADLAVVRDVAGRHDVIFVADNRFGFRSGAARDGVMLANLVAIADFQIAARAREIFVERIGPEHGACGNFVALAQSGPAFHEDVRFESRFGANNDVLLDNREIADDNARSDHRIGMNARGRGDYRRGINWHSRISRPRPGLRQCTSLPRRSGPCGAPSHSRWFPPCASRSCRTDGRWRSSRR